MRHSIRRILATAAAGGGAAATIVGLSVAAPAAATTVVPEGAEQLVRVELHTLEPATPAPGDQVEITGSITNITGEPLRNVQALLRYDGRPLTSRSDIARIPADADLHWGWRPGHIYEIVRDELPPGESASFDLEFTAEIVCADAEPTGPPCLALPAEGVYAIGVDGNVTTGDDDRHTGGTARTVVPWQITDADPIPVALLWSVVGTPDIVAGPPATPRQDRTVPELDRLLAAPDGAPVTWAVDPQTWSPAMAEAVDDGGELMVLPPSVPDAGSLARADRDLTGAVAAETVRLQRRFAPTEASVPTRIDAAWPGAGAVTEDALRAWADAGAKTVVLPADAVAMPERSATASLDIAGERLSAILTDPGLDSAIADNAGAGGQSARSAALDLRQRWLAETAMARDELFGTATASLVAAPPVTWRPAPEVLDAVLDVWTGTDWIEPTGISGITGTVPPHRATAPAAVLRPLAAGRDGLPADYVQEVRRLHDDLTRYHSLLDDSGTPADSPTPPATPAAGEDAGTSVESPADGSGSAGIISSAGAGPALTAARAASVAWRDDVDTAQTQVAALRGDVAEALNGVSVVVNPSNTLSSNTGVFPVNITNGLAHAVTVRLEFDPGNEDRLAIEPVEARVPGGQQQTVQVRAEAVANGEVPVSVQLATVDGAPLGGPQHTTVNATEYGTIGWFAVAGSALLFAGGLAWRMLRGRRRAER